MDDSTKVIKKEIWQECLDQFQKYATRIQKDARSTGYPWLHFCNGCFEIY